MLVIEASRLARQLVGQGRPAEAAALVRPHAEAGDYGAAEWLAELLADLLARQA